MSSKNPLRSNEQAGEQIFTYPAVTAGDSSETGKDAQRKRQWMASIGTTTSPDRAAIEQREQQARHAGIEEGKAAARIEFNQNLAKLQDEMGRALRDFAKDRDTYFHRVEEQVVRLALAIVRKILHRESQIDPLLLTGILRVALDKIDASSSIKLRANPADIKSWREYFGQTTEKYPAPELIGDPGLEPGRCVLETELGTTEIGLETQLKEIENGFLDLLAERPGSK